MGNQSSHTKELGRQPNDKEIMILYRLQKLLYTRLLQSPQVYLITSIPSLIVRFIGILLSPLALEPFGAILESRR